MIYFDNAATTQVSEAAAKEVNTYMLEQYANPSAAYRFGVEAGRKLSDCRERMAKLLAVEAADIIFTSCATESNNQAIRGIMQANRQKGNRLLYSAAEHPSVANTAVYMQQFEGVEAEAVPIDAYGRIRLDALEEMLQKPTVLLCLQAVNNELGIIQPLREAIDLAHRYGAYVLVDAVQAFGKIPFKPKALGADAVSISGHKLHAPKGIGVLWLSPKIRCRSLIQGGGQEQNRRSGTENLPYIAALITAAEDACRHREEYAAQMMQVRNTLLEVIERDIKDIRINTLCNESAPHILNMSFAGAKSEVLLHYLEQSGICVSAGSACSTHKNADSGKNALLMACGLEDKWTESCLRFSFSHYNTVDEAAFAAEALCKAVEEIRIFMR